MSEIPVSRVRWGSQIRILGKLHRLEFVNECRALVSYLEEVEVQGRIIRTRRFVSICPETEVEDVFSEGLQDSERV